MPDSSQTETSFCRVPSNLWFVRTDERTVLEALLDAPPFDQILETLASSIDSVIFSRERCDENHKYFRVSATITFSSAHAVRLFHSASTGYRAQYFCHPETGESANRFALHRLCPSVLSAISMKPKRSCALPWARLSLADESAKVWIHQGSWARWRENRIKLLHIDRWRSALPVGKDAKRLRLSPLVPDQETRIDVKGGFVSLAGKPLGSLKPSRPIHIHTLGFS
jgi:hypothetical protein